MRATLLLVAAFSPLAPVLTIQSGDRVRLENFSGNPRYYESLGVPKERIPAELYAVYEGVEGTGRGDHALVGPIYVNGAEPGDTLEVRIESVDVRHPGHPRPAPEVDLQAVGQRSAGALPACSFQGPSEPLRAESSLLLSL